MTNIFKQLACFGQEDFFTASLALFIERNESFRNAFLNWIEPHVGETLISKSWTIELQKMHRSAYGEAYLDMVLINPELELWFEHKVGAALGKYKDSDGNHVDQIEKYLDTAARVMTGIDNGEDDAPWPTDGPTVEGQGRVLLFYISRSGKQLDANRYSGRVHCTGNSGVVIPEDNTSLRWKDFYPIGKAALEESLQGNHGVFEATLTQHFIDYWTGIRGMWRQLEFSDEWLELLPNSEGLSVANPAPFVNYLSEIEHEFASRLDWEIAEHWEGKTVVFRTAINTAQKVEFSGIRTIEEIPDYDPSLGNETVKITIRLDSGTTIPPRQTKTSQFENFKGLVAHKRSGNRDILYVYVGVTKWNQIHTKKWRYQQLMLAFVAGLQMAKREFNIVIPNLDEF
jgi:hypothetical protein